MIMFWSTGPLLAAVTSTVGTSAKSGGKNLSRKFSYFTGFSGRNFGSVPSRIVPINSFAAASAPAPARSPFSALTPYHRSFSALASYRSYSSVAGSNIEKKDHQVSDAMSGGRGVTSPQPANHHHAHENETEGLYNFPAEHHHGSGREHLWEDGTRKWNYTTDGYHWDDPYRGTPKQDIVVVNGQKMIKGIETRPLNELFCVSQANMPFWPRNRLNFWGNYPLVLKAEFLFFWVPVMIIWSLVVPIFTLLYMADEAIYNTMTVKVIGRQWYWVYEVESPTDE